MKLLATTVGAGLLNRRTGVVVLVTRCAPYYRKSFGPGCDKHEHVHIYFGGTSASTGATARVTGRNYAGRLPRAAIR